MNGALGIPRGFDSGALLPAVSFAQVRDRFARDEVNAKAANCSDDCSNAMH
jgi:hypothetical protein